MSGTGMEEVITFKFSHFMSPNSVYPAAHSLYDRHYDHLGIDNKWGIGYSRQ